MSLESTKADDIAVLIEEAIVSGELAPGSVLRQEQLSERFGVSRTPVREALRKLAALGLVSFEPNKGVRVRTLSHDDLREAFLVRAELEALYERNQAEHRAIRQALVAHSVAGARELAHEHVMHSFELLTTILAHVAADWAVT